MKYYTIVFITFLTFISNMSFSQTINWVQKQSLPDAYRNGAAISCNGKIYFMGGYCNATPEIFEKSNYEYDPKLNKWTVKAQMLTGHSNFAMAAIDNKIYVIGGDPFSGKNEIYDPAKNKWDTLQPMLTPRQHVTCAVVNSKIYVIGGLMDVPYSSAPSDWSYKNITNKNEVYDPSTNKWEEKSPMPTNRHGAFIAAVNGNIYVIGGMGTEKDIWKGLDIVEMYDPLTDKWHKKASLPEARDGFGITVVNNKIYVIGGFSKSGIVNTVYIYDPVLNKWNYSTNFPNNINGSCGCASINNKIYIITGCDINYNATSNVFEGEVNDQRK